MKTRIWKKICNRIRIVENEDGYFVVQSREKLILKKGFTEWRDLNSFGTYKNALNKKHVYIIMILTRELGIRQYFIDRRTKMKKIKEKKRQYNLAV